MKKSISRPQLFRSREQKIIAGVCGGLADFFDIEVTLIRLAFVVLTLIGGSGVLIYIVLALITPLEPTNHPEHHTITKAKRKKLFGFIAIGLGIIFLTNNLAPTVWQNFSHKFFLPFLIIAFGCLLILKKSN